jgi:hypothetical protein
MLMKPGRPSPTAWKDSPLFFLRALSGGLLSTCIAGRRRCRYQIRSRLTNIPWQAMALAVHRSNSLAGPVTARVAIRLAGPAPGYNDCNRHTFSLSDSRTGPLNDRECAIEDEDGETFVSMRVRFGSASIRNPNLRNNLGGCFQLMDLLYSALL